MGQRFSVRMPVLTRGGESLLFLHIPKCGGTSIVDTFAAAGFDVVWQIRGKPPLNFLFASPQHQTCDVLRTSIRFDRISELFALVRNPYERIRSEYKWANRSLPAQARPTIGDWIEHNLAKAKEDPHHLDNHLRPMVDFFDPDIPVNIFFFENGINSVVDCFLAGEMSSGKVRLVHEKNSIRYGYDAEQLRLGDREIRLINSFYACDFQAFGYPMHACELDDQALQSPSEAGANSHKTEVIQQWIRLSKAQHHRHRPGSSQASPLP